MKLIIIDANYCKGRGGCRYYENYAPTLSARQYKEPYYLMEVQEDEQETARNDREVSTG